MRIIICRQFKTRTISLFFTLKFSSLILNINQKCYKSKKQLKKQLKTNKKKLKGFYLIKILKRFDGDFYEK